MWGEPFSAEMKCPICNRMTPHLIELDSIHFIQKVILFHATCSVCEDSAFEAGEKASSYLYKCDYEYFNSITPLEDEPCKN